jgi:hypothetical protein
LGRKSWLFAGSDRGGARAATIYSLIVTAKMNDVDPQAWLADVLARIAEHPAKNIEHLLCRMHQRLNVFPFVICRVACMSAPTMLIIRTVISVPIICFDTKEKITAN